MPGRHEAPDRGDFWRELIGFLLVLILWFLAFIVVLALIVPW